MSYPGAIANLAPEAPPRHTIITGWAKIIGTPREPMLQLHIHPKLSHPRDGRLTMKDWLKSAGTAWWDPHEQAWTCTGLNTPHLSATLAEAGIELDWETRPAEFAEVPSIDDLVMPITQLAKNRRTVLVRPRLAGFDYAKQLLGLGAVYDKDRRIFRTPVSDVLIEHHGNLEVRGGVWWPQDAIDAAYAAHAHVPVHPELADIARRLGQALSMEEFTEDERSFLRDRLGALPADGREPFAYQEVGSYAVAAGRTCLFDEPGVGKTAGSLLAARILGARRTVIVVPPLLTTNWRREIGYAALCPDEQVVTFKPGRKEPALPEAGAVIISDSLLANRPAVLARLVEWGADVMIVDEAHRIKTIGSARGEAVLDLGASVKHAPIALTGTPIFASPHEIVTMLELTRMLAPVFGGRHQFLADFCTQNRFGSFMPRQSALDRLQVLLRTKVWVRRRKADVLPQLPPKLREAMVLDVPLKAYRETHKEVISKVHGWLTWFEEQNGRPPSTEELDEWAKSASISLISQLRQAAGLAKIAQAAELIENHINETGWVEGSGGRRIFNRPLLVWVHHKSVAMAMVEALPASIGETGLIGGATSDAERDRLVDDFQDGLVPVMVCSIMKAGVGLTLTASSDHIFVELDWTPANVIQCEDRSHRPGQVAESIQITSLVAKDTLDETIQNVLGRKIAVLERALGDSGNGVAVAGEDYARGLSEITATVIDQAVRTHKRKGT